jgi:hypothetical protein
MSRLSRLVGGAFALCVLAGPAAAEQSAILVGVSSYGGEAGIPNLEGPKNDVPLMHQALGEIGIGRITVLADGVDIDGAAVPTRANIDAAFAAAVEGAGKDDLVILYLSGHGTRQHDLNGDEADGYDEVFLPADVTKASTSTSQQTIPNALVDDEIGAFIDAVRMKGGNVWLIMDSCFSATGARAPNTAMRGRRVVPSALGITQAPREVSVRETPEAAPELGPDAGGFVAFYAAQAFEEAKEFNFALDDEGEPEWYGLFTAKLADRLRTAGNASYRQLFEAVLDDMNDAGLTGARAPQTPYREGTMLDAGIGLAEGVRQYPLSGGGRQLEAGTIQGITVGSVLAVVADATAGDDEAIGYIQIHRARALSSSIFAVGADCAGGDAETLCQALPRDQAGFLADARYARLVSPAIALVLKLSEPLVLDETPDPARDAALRSALAGVAAKDPEQLGTRIELDAPDYDLLVGFKNGRIWFADADGFADGDLPSNIAWPHRSGIAPDPRDLENIVLKAAKAHNLIKLAGNLGDQMGLVPPLLTVNAEIAESDAALLYSPDEVASSQTYRPEDECQDAATRQTAELEPAALVKQCDSISFHLKATGVRTAIDVNRIYIDANFGIHVEHERLEGPIIDDMVGGLIMCSECPDEATGGLALSAGPETVLFVTAEATPNQRPLDLSELAQEGLPSASRGDKGGAGQAANPARDLLLSFAAPGGKTRGNLSSAMPEMIEVQMFNWRLLPRAAALSDSIAVAE